MGVGKVSFKNKLSAKVTRWSTQRGRLLLWVLESTKCGQRQGTAGDVDGTLHHLIPELPNAVL